MTEKDREKEQGRDPFGYMEELSEAYREAFAKRLAKSKPLADEKRDFVIKAQLDLSRTAGKLAVAFTRQEKKELARMMKESAEEILRVLAYDEEEIFAVGPLVDPPVELLLSRAVLLANRSLNACVRHAECDLKLFSLITSELSAIYALAALS